MKVVLTKDAIRDLNSIRLHISLESPRAAVRVTTRLMDACDSLAFFPERGRRGSEPGTRESVVVRPYVIVYRIVLEQVDILRVWHAAQNRTAE